MSGEGDKLTEGVADEVAEEVADGVGDKTAEPTVPEQELFDIGKRRLSTNKSVDTEELTGRTFPYQFDLSLVEDVDLMAETPGKDLNWLEDITLMTEDGVPAVFDRYTNAFLKIHFDIPEGREDEIARKVLITHLKAGNSYGIWLKRKHAKFPQRELGSWTPDSETVGTDYQRPTLEGWTPSAH